MIKLTAKFKPANGYTQDFIQDDIIPKLNKNLPVVADATRDQLVQAVGAFFAHGMKNFVVDYEANPLFEEVCTKLVNYGWLRPDHIVKGVYRQSMPHNRLEFATLNSDPTLPNVKTVYGTRYTDGTHGEVNPEDITYINHYTVENYERLHGKLA